MTPLSSDPGKIRQWQERSAKRAAQRRKEAAGTKHSQGERKEPHTRAQRSGRKKARQNDGPWRKACIEAHGEWCRACGTRPVQMDHIHPKSQGGKNDVGNGLPLCAEHHRMKTDSEIVIEWSWLSEAHLVYLRESGWVDWGADGQPFGRGWRHFSARPV